MNQDLERLFPGLRNTFYARTSPPTPVYNCIAWSAGDDRHYWWPDGKNYWPDGIPCEDTIEAFEIMYVSLGYAITMDDAPIKGIEKIALFARGAAPKHAARQLGSGMWTSKLGRHVDIAHELRGLEGKEYGKVVRIFQRGIPALPVDSQGGPAVNRKSR